MAVVLPWCPSFAVVGNEVAEYHPPNMAAESSQDAERFSFDGQGATFDRRAGLPEEVWCRFAAEIWQQIVGRPLVVEVGCGTAKLAEPLMSLGARYVGFDRSYDMVSRAQPTTRNSQRITLLVADANRCWPLASNVAGALVLSRVAHLLEPQALVKELMRVGCEGASVVLARVRRQAHSLRRQLRQKLHELLDGETMAPRDSRDRTRHLVDLLEARGGRLLRSTELSYAVRETVRSSLESWRCKSGLAGRSLPADMKQRILEQLESWARRLGAPDDEQVVEERLVLEIVRLPEATAVA